MRLFASALAGSVLAAALAACAPTLGGGGAGGGDQAAPSDDTCGRAAMTPWIGRKIRDLPQAPAGAVWRLACTTCAVTMDYRAERLTIVYREADGTITDLKCG